MRPFITALVTLGAIAILLALSLTGSAAAIETNDMDMQDYDTACVETPEVVSLCFCAVTVEPVIQTSKQKAEPAQKPAQKTPQKSAAVQRCTSKVACQTSTCKTPITRVRIRRLFAKTFNRVQRE